MQIESSRPRRGRHRTVVALFAAAAAFGGGAQALAPATAGAMINQGNECANLDGLDLFFCELEHMGAGGGGGSGAGPSGSDGAETATPRDPSDRSGGQTEEQRNERYVQSDDVGLPTWISDRDSYWATVQRRWSRQGCTRIRKQIKHRIHRLYGEDFDVDRVVGSDDDTLNTLEDEWANRDCSSLTHF
jgi:hypothetical protein